jgi:hypothetical protein
MFSIAARYDPPFDASFADVEDDVTDATDVVPV